VTETRVVNMSRAKFDLRIDRRTQWGNPFHIGFHGSRDEVIAKYETYIRQRPNLLADLSFLKGKRLGCHCKPLACHGDVLVRLISEYCP
jgi:hypothetical protein